MSITKEGLDVLKKAKVVFVCCDEMTNKNVAVCEDTVTDFLHGTWPKISKEGTSHKKFPESGLHVNKVRANLEKILSEKTDCVLYTHSGAMLNYAGEIISRKRIESNYFAVLVLDKDCRVVKRVSYFNEDGVLENWNFGYLG